MCLLLPLCSLECDGSMMNNVMGNKSVFGHFFSFISKHFSLACVVRPYIQYFCNFQKLSCCFLTLDSSAFLFFYHCAAGTVATRIPLWSAFYFLPTSLQLLVLETGLSFEQVQQRCNTARDSSPQNQKYMFLLLPVELFISLDSVAVSCLVLEISAVEISAFALR